MKKSTFLIFLMLNSLFLLSQTNEALDAKNGFKDFKFGDLMSLPKYKNNIVKSFKSSDYIYQYTSSIPNSLFDWEWSHLFFGFHKQKLGMVQVFWNDDKKLYDDILRNLELAFGKSTTVSQTALFEEQTLAYNEWEGKNVIMTLRRYNSNYTSNPCDDCRITLIVKHKGMEKSKASGDF